MRKRTFRNYRLSNETWEAHNLYVFDVADLTHFDMHRSLDDKVRDLEKKVHKKFDEFNIIPRDKAGVKMHGSGVSEFFDNTCKQKAIDYLRYLEDEDIGNVKKGFEISKNKPLLRKLPHIKKQIAY